MSSRARSSKHKKHTATKNKKQTVLNLDVSAQDLEEVQRLTGCDTEQAALECIAAHAEPILDIYACDIPKNKYFWSPVDKKAVWALVSNGALIHHQCLKACDDLERFEKWEASKTYEPSQYGIMARFYYFLAQIVSMSSLRRFGESLRHATKDLSTGDLDFMMLLLQLVEDKYSGVVPIVPRTKDEFLVNCVNEIAKDAKGHTSKSLAEKALKRVKYTMKRITDIRCEANKSEDLNQQAQAIVQKDKEKKEEKEKETKKDETDGASVENNDEKQGGAKEQTHNVVKVVESK